MVKIKILHCKKKGIKNNLVLLHGWGWNMDVWYTLLPELQNLYNLILIDFSEFEKAIKTKNENYLEQIVNQALPMVPYHSIFLGWSLGGVIASWIAFKYPAYVKKLILVAYSPRFLQDYAWPGIDPKSFESFLFFFENKPHLSLQYFFKLQCDGIISTKKNNLYKLFFSNKYTPKALKEGLRLLYYTDFRQEFFNLKVPILLLYGQLDQIVPIAICKKFNENKLKVKIVILKEAGHLPFLINPNWFYRELYKFIEEKKVVPN